MTNVLTIEAIPTAVADRIRNALCDDYGNVLSPLVDDGGAPCRHCLKDTLPGESVLLFSYKPFAATHPYQEVGPVFIHADACGSFEPANGLPEDMLKRTLVLRPYDRSDRIAGAQKTARPGEALSIAAGFLEDPDVAYVHARTATRGCYLFRIERG